MDNTKRYVVLAAIPALITAMVLFGIGQSGGPDEEKTTADDQVDDQKRGHQKPDRQKTEPPTKKAARCKNGCSVNHHPVEELTKQRFRTLMKQYRAVENPRNNRPLDHLLYFGDHTEEFLKNTESVGLPAEKRRVLNQELRRDSVLLSLRMEDREGQVRLQFSSVRVPLGKKKKIPIKTAGDITPPKLSGAVKRTAENHLWMRY